MCVVGLLKQKLPSSPAEIIKKSLSTIQTTYVLADAKETKLQIYIISTGYTSIHITNMKLELVRLTVLIIIHQELVERCLLWESAVPSSAIIHKGIIF
jgi:hypothetical protein